MNGPYANKYGNPSPAGGAKTVSVNDGKTTINLPLAGITRSVPASFVDNEASGRIDWQASSKDRIFGRYLFQRQLNADAAGTTSAGTFVDVPDEGQQLGIDWVRNWTSTFLNQARFSYSKTTLSFEGQKGGTKQFAGCTVANINSCPTRIDFSGGNLGSAGFATNLPQARLVKVTSYQDNAQWVRGRHTIKFGGEFDHQFSPNDFLPSINGRFRFSSFTTLLKNTPNNATIGDGVVRLNFKENDLAFYGQDDWKVLDNLTLNLGLRWEWNQQAINLLHDLTVKRETGPNPFWDPTLPLAARTVPKVPEALKNFGPNIGFAFTPRGFGPVFGEGKTVIRGGFRIAYDPSFYNIFLNVATAAPTVNLASLATPSRPVPAGVLYNGTEIRAAKLPLIPRGGNPGFRNQTQVTKNFHNPYSEQYSLGLQREITPKIAAEVRYVGNHTVGNFQTINANPALISAFTGENQAALFPGSVPAGVVPCTTAGTPGAGEGRIDCSHALVRLRANSAYSFYNGLQTELRVRAYHGLSGSLGYTFSRTIDNVSEIFSTFGGGNSIAGSQNFFDNKLAERNVNGTSYPNVLTVSYIYDFPFYKSQQGFVGKVLGGWETSGIYSYHTGQPYTAVEAGGLATYCDDNFNFSFFGASTCRPAVGNPNAPLDTVGQCTTTAPGCNPVDFFGGTATQFHYIYNDTLYAKSVKNPFGGAGRNTLRGQTFNNLDVALYKNVKATERLTMQLGVTAGNVLNRQYRGVPDPVIEDGRFDISGPAASNPAFNPGGTYQNTFGNSSGRRRLNFGVRLIF